jgi:hypothetical protein
LPVAADADFADLFEVKGGRARRHEAARVDARDSTLRFSSRGKTRLAVDVDHDGGS